MATSSLTWDNPRPPGFWRATAAIFRKDLTSEFRSRFAINTLLLFSVTTLTVVSFSTARIVLPKEVQSALIWVVIFFSAMTGLSRSFVREEESRTADTLRMAAASEPVFFGKFIFNLSLLMLLELLVVPLALVFWRISVESPGMFAVTLVAGDIGLAAVSSIMAAIVAQTNMQSALFAVLSFPILIPLLFTAVKGTLNALQADIAWGEALIAIRMLVVFGLVMLIAGLLLFDYVWRE